MTEKTLPHSTILAEVARVLFDDAAKLLRGEETQPLTREDCINDAAYACYTARHAEAMAWRMRFKEKLSHVQILLMRLVARQFRKFSEQRQVLVSTLRKRAWREAKKPSAALQTVLFLSEVPRLLNKMVVKVEAQDEVATSRGWRSRAAKTIKLQDHVRAKAIEKCMQKTYRAKGIVPARVVRASKGLSKVANTPVLIYTHAGSERYSAVA